jgi:shikimate kinase
MARPHRIVLIGLSGTGKSRVARLVARRLRWMSADTDDQIVSLDGRAIPQIFREEGEAQFRTLERQAVAQLTKGDRRVLATGGGAVLDPVNREHLWRDSFVVHLDARSETILGRINRGDPRRAAARPLLAGEDPAARLEDLRVARAPLYALADWTVRTDGLTLDQVADEVVGAWQRVSEAVVAARGPHPPAPSPNPGRGGVW